MRVLGILGSPRSEGNSAALLRMALRGAEDGGAEVALLDLSRRKFAPCRGCGLCREEGVCVLDDGAMGAYEDLLSADGLIVATPVYFGGLPAAFKAFVDRAQAIYWRKYHLGRRSKRKKGFLICVSGMRGHPEYMWSCLVVIRTWFKVIDADLSKVLYFPGFGSPKGASRDEVALSTAYSLGRALGEGRI